jgi:hypothetical protein
VGVVASEWRKRLVILVHKGENELQKIVGFEAKPKQARKCTNRREPIREKA